LVLLGLAMDQRSRGIAGPGDGVMRPCADNGCEAKEGTRTAHDPEKCEAVFRSGHAPRKWAVSSAVEHWFYTPLVGSSILSPPTSLRLLAASLGSASHRTLPWCNYGSRRKARPPILNRIRV